MNWKTWAPLLLAVVLGLVAMKVARDMMAKSGSQPQAETGTAVAVLTKDLPAGSAISAEDLTTTTLAGEVNTDAVFTSVQEVEGRVLISGAIKGAPLLRTMFAPEGAGSGLQSLIPDGMRAITIEINEFSGVAGNLTPGCRVDVVTTFGADGPDGMISRTVVQNVEVQSLGMRRTGEDDPNMQIRSVTLLATPKEAESIELAAATGRPRLVLRSSADDQSIASTGVSVRELRGRESSQDPFGTGFAVDEDPEPEPEPVAVAPPAPVTPVGTTPVETAPAPEPIVVPVAQVRQPRRRERQITVIRGGIESQATVEDPAPQKSAPRWMTNVGVDDLQSNPQN